MACRGNARMNRAKIAVDNGHDGLVGIDGRRLWRRAAIAPEWNFVAAERDTRFNTVEIAVIDADILFGADILPRDVIPLPDFFRALRSQERYGTFCRGFQRTFHAARHISKHLLCVLEFSAPMHST